VYYQDKTRILM